MADAPAPAPTAPASPAQSSASDAALFGKFTAQHQQAVAQELGKSHADAPKNVRGSEPSGKPADHVERAAAADAARDAGGGEDAGTERDGSGSEEGRADAAGGAEAEAAKPAALSESDALALLRKSRDEGDTAGIDRALRALLPDSKGLSEFNVDGKRYGEFRGVVKRATAKLTKREEAVSTRERNVATGLAQVEQLVQRYSPVEKLMLAAQDDSDEGVEAFVELLQTVTKKPLNDTLKRHLDKKLGKPVDPELDAVRRELRSEKEARLERERKEAEDRATAERTTEIRNHLQFLHTTLSTAEDHRVRALVGTREGIKAIFEAQQAHYNPQTRQTISAAAAAKWVLEQKQKELEPWERVLKAPATAAATPTAPADEKREAIETPRVRALPSHGGAPASGGTKRLSDTELFEKYERLAKLAGD